LPATRALKSVIFSIVSMLRGQPTAPSKLTLNKF
jgi:hypothetical protein